MSIKSNLKMGLVLLAVGSGSAAIAADRLACPEGTVQARITDKGAETLFCQNGAKLSHGPFITRTTTGVVIAQGQTENGNRTGKWLHFDNKGVKLSEIEFKNGDFHGKHVEFHANGQVKKVEMFNAGAKVGAPQQFDVTGKTITAAK